MRGVNRGSKPHPAFHFIIQVDYDKAVELIGKGRGSFLRFGILLSGVVVAVFHEDGGTGDEVVADGGFA